MSQASSIAPTWTELVPWTDKRGRFHKLRAVTFALLLLPAAYLASRWIQGELGPRAVNAAIHSTGYYAVWILLCSLAVTPFKALSGIPNVVVIRRMIGNAALAYACVHLTLYTVDQNFRLLTVVSEIVKRFYLTIGFVALLGLTVLGATSTDGWARRLGATWKRIHRAVYAIMVLGLAHYVLQSKLDVSQSMLAIGIFLWLMLWRLLPAGHDRRWPPLLAISVLACLLTLATEYLWYRLGTRANALRFILSEADVEGGLQPAGQVLVFGLLVTGMTELRRLGQGPAGDTLPFTMIVYALGALTDDVAALIMGWSIEDITPDGVSRGGLDVLWMALLALLAMARWKLRQNWQRHMVDALWVACLFEHLVTVGTGSRSTGAAAAAIVVACAVVLGKRLWNVSRGAALTIVPLGLLLAYEVAGLLL